MSEANKSLMLSEAEIIEAINSDSLISVSLGAGLPQKNVKMSTLASVAAELIFGAASTSNKKYISTSANNVYLLSIDISSISSVEGFPLKWELYGGMWGKKDISYADGICRKYATGEGNFNNAILRSNSIALSPTVSISTSGILTIEFGVQLSYAALFVYF